MKHFHILPIVRPEVHMTVSMKSAVFWDMILCTPVKVCWHFRGPCCRHHQGRHTPWKWGYTPTRVPAIIPYKTAVIICISRHYKLIVPINLVSAHKNSDYNTKCPAYWNYDKHNDTRLLTVCEYGGFLFKSWPQTNCTNILLNKFQKFFLHVKMW